MGEKNPMLYILPKITWLKEYHRIHRVWKRLETAVKPPVRDAGRWESRDWAGMWKYNCSLGKLSAHEPVLWPHELTCVESATGVLSSCHHLLPAEDLALSSQHGGQYEGLQCFFATVQRPWDQRKRSYICFARLIPQRWQGEPCYWLNYGLLPLVSTMCIHMGREL